jgi:hypothetical protein
MKSGPDVEVLFEGKPIAPKRLKGGVIEFPTTKGGIYEIVNI